MKKITTYLYILPAFLVLSLGGTAQDLSDEELLNMSLDELMDIDVVNVSKLNLSNLSEVPSAVTVITAEQIATSGAKNMEEVLRNVPGFDVIRTGFDPSTNLGVRGLYSTTGTNNKILFLVDDHPVRSIFYGDATVFIGNFPLENIKQIEIIRGPGSTLFGAGAFLGVINIRTNRPDKTANVSVGHGSFGRYNLNAQATGKVGEDLSITASADYFTTNGPEEMLMSDIASELVDPIFRTTLGYDGPSGSAVPGVLNYGRSTAAFNLKVDYQNFYLLGSHMSSEDEVPIGFYETYSDGSITENVAQYLEMGYRGKTKNQQGELLIKGYSDRYKFDSKSELWAAETSEIFNFLTELSYSNPIITREPTFYAPGEAQTLYRVGVNNVYGGEVNFAYNFDNIVNVLGGVMYEHHNLGNIETRANGNVLFDRVQNLNGTTYLTFEAYGQTLDTNEDFGWISDRSRDIYAVFGQADFNLKNLLNAYGLEQFSLVAGIRYDDYNDVGGSANPRIGLLIAPDKHFYFKGLFGTAFRAPSFVELYSKNNSYVVGNTEIEAENVRTIEFVGGYRINKDFDANLTYFNTKITDNIQLVPDPRSALVQNRYVNAGDIETSGIEAELRYNFKTSAFLSASFTYQDVLDVTEGDFITGAGLLSVDSEVEQEDFDPGRAPDFIFNLMGNYPITSNINFNTSLNYLAERKRSEALVFEVDENFEPTDNIIQADSRDPIDARAIWNASVTLKDFDFLPGVSLQLTGYNLLDARNENPTLLIRGDDITRAGINWGISLRAKF